VPENEPVRRYEFDLYRGEAERRISNLERDLRDLEDEHDTDMENLARERRESRRWTWQQVMAAIGAGGVVVGLFLQARGR
jgi:ferric-dicitrate binding protein FerR (iron transport regulator)